MYHGYNNDGYKEGSSDWMDDMFKIGYFRIYGLFWMAKSEVARSYINVAAHYRVW